MVKFMAYSHNFIDVKMSLPGKEDWRLTCSYSFPERSHRRQSWDLLRKLANRSSLPWCCIGDFSDMLYISGKGAISVTIFILSMGFRRPLKIAIWSIWA